MRRWARGLAAGLAAIAVGAAGLDPAIEAKTRAFLERPALIDAVGRAVTTQAETIPFACPALTLTPADLLIDLPLPRFDAAGTMIDGRVRQRFVGSGCGSRRLLFNIWVIAAPGEAPRAVAAYPGTTGAAVDLQLAATPTATVAAGRAIGGCGALDVIDTKEIGPDAPGSAAWQELWLVGGCGMFAQVVLHFIPDRELRRTLVEAPPQGVRRIELR